MHDLPIEMIRGNRAADPGFVPEERLYFRIPPHPPYFNTKKSGDKRIDLTAIQLPDQSVNRSKHGGRPEFVRCNVYPGTKGQCDGRHHSWPVAYLNVRDANRDVLTAGSAAFSTRVEHVPLQYNYFHSEIRAYKPDGSRIGESKPSELHIWDACIRWRNCVRACAKLILEPTTT